MTRKHLLIGISAAALAAGTASAQTSTDSNGNTESVQCSPASFCDVDNQVAGNDRNFGFIRSNGTNNVGTITQRGDDNSSTIEQTGDGNTARHFQNGDRHRSDTDQTGEDNVSRIEQRDFSNSATVVQVQIDDANAGQDEFTQPLDAPTESGNTGRPANNQSFVAQGTQFFGGGGTDLGEDNVVSVSQRGNNLISVIQQAGNTGGASADDNNATVNQQGNGSLAIVQQSSRGNSATVRMFEGGVNAGTGNNRRNQSVVFQTNTRFQSDGSGGFTTANGAPTAANNPRSGNVADVSITGQQNQSSVGQDGVQNTAVVSMLGGGSTDTGAGGTDAEGRTFPGGRIQGNQSTVSQTGRGNFYEISAGGRATSTTPNGQGNQSSVTQGGSGGTAAEQAGRGHRATVFQRGILDSVSIDQQNNAQGAGGAIQSGSVADVSQLSFNSTTTITQRGTNTAIVTQGVNRNNAAGTAVEVGGNNSTTIDQTDAGDTTTGTGGPFPNPTTQTQSNFVEVVQYGRNNTASVTQNAVNARAVVFQPIGSRVNSLNIQQGTGNGLTPAGAGGTGNVTNAATSTGAGQGSAAGNLSANVTQSGRNNTATVGQAGTNLTATVNQTGNLGVTTFTAGSANSVNVSQVNTNNVASVTQSGNRHTATVDQRGAGGADSSATGGRDLRNRVTVEQTGDRHTATATQDTGVGPSGTDTTANPASGPSGDTFARAAGRQSAEIQIIQQGARASGTTTGGNTANVRQQGVGQFARIFQNGRDNNAGILQTSTATNAVAVIEQTGDGNSFFITQQQPGQFMRVTQNGNANANTTTVSSGPTNVGGTTPGGNGSSTTPVVFP